MGQRRLTVRRGRFARFLQLVCFAVVPMAVGHPSAAAAVTLGQLAPGTSPSTSCVNANASDIMQPTVTSGDAYVVPAVGGITAWTVTSWSHNAGAGGGQALAFKVFRHTGGTTYMAVGHDGPRALAPSTVNTFAGISIPVKPGDIIGLNKGTVPTACLFGVPGESYRFRQGDLADGQSGSFQEATNDRVNISAVVTPTNSFTLGPITRNKKKGTATLTVDVPNPGELTGSGKGVRAAGAAVISKTVTAPGKVKLTIRAKGKKKRKLNETGKVKVKPKVTYTPTGGDPSTQPRKLKLKKKL